MYKKIKSLFAIISIFILIGCNSNDYTPIENNVTIPTGTAFNTLSEYNFFKGTLRDLALNDGVIPYDLNMPLFSDYALKKRFVYVPEGNPINFDTENVLDFPEKSVFIKNFYYTENGIDNIIETRLLIKKADGWYPETYIWNEDQTKAERSVIGATMNLTVTVNGSNETFSYLIPNQNQCANCHALHGKTDLIGPRIQNLNRDYTYSSGTQNQIDYWVSQGVLESPDATVEIPKWSSFNDTSNSINDRARAYLDVNCASCHRSSGSAANSGFFLDYYNENELSLGIYKTPVAAGNGSGGFTYVIEPGNADESILTYRMNTSEINARMPEIGRELIHQEGVQLIKDWINSL